MVQVPLESADQLQEEAVVTKLKAVSRVLREGEVEADTPPFRLVARTTDQGRDLLTRVELVRPSVSVGYS